MNARATPGRGGRGIAALTALAAGLALPVALAGCAKKGPPSGGPPDLTPPRVIATSPDSGRAGVARDTRVSVTFSEGMEPRGTGEAASLAPRVEIRQRRWSGRTLTLVLAESLHAHRTYTLFLGEGARDLHGNSMVGGATVVFSTADSFPHGRIEGIVDARGFPVSGTYLWCYEATGNRAPDSTARDFDAVGIAGLDGRFRIDGLSVPGRYRIWAFADLNDNRSFEPQTDILAPADTVFVLTATDPVASHVRLRVVNPRAQARVEGAVLDTLRGDTVGVIRVVAVADTDSTRRTVADADPKGGFQLALNPGRWRLSAFRDLDKNRTWRPDVEPFSDPLGISLAPADTMTNVVLVLRRGRGVP